MADEIKLRYRDGNGREWPLSLEEGQAAAFLSLGRRPELAEDAEAGELTVLDAGARGGVFRRPVRPARPAQPELLDIFGLAGHHHRPLLTLNPEMKLRRMLAEAFSEAPEVLVIAFPLSAALYEALRAARQHTCQTLVYVADGPAAAEDADILALTRDGALLQADAPEEIRQHPACPEAAHWISGMNQLQGVVIAKGPGNKASLDVSGLTIPSYVWGREPAIDQPVTLLVHREEIRCSTALRKGFHLSGLIAGGKLELPDGQQLELPADVQEPEGTRLFVWWEPEHTGVVFAV